MEKVYVIRKVSYHINRKHDDEIEDYDQMMDLLERLDDESRDVAFKNFFDAAEAIKGMIDRIEFWHICKRVEKETLSYDNWSTTFNAKDKTGMMTINYDTKDFDLTLIFTIKEVSVIVYDED